MPEGSDEFSWNVITHEHRERSVDWYWALGVSALLGAVISVFFGNVLLAVIIIIGAGSLGALAARGPREHAVRVDKRGISVDGTLYPYASIHSFWIERETEYPRLFISTTGVLAPHFNFEIHETINIDRLEVFLKQFAKEEEQGPHVGEYLAEIFGL